MNNKEMIEKMARDIFSLKFCDTSFEENCKLLAYDLITFGWIKLDKDSVVLSREEYNDYLNLKDLLDKGYFTSENRAAIHKTRKKTAREITNLIYATLTNRKVWVEMQDWWLEGKECYPLKNLLNELVEQYEAEIKE